MASGAAPCSDQRSSAKAADKAPPPPQGHRSRKWATDGGAAAHCENCVVCGDRACNHHYYGVAACHGCKCFFWRSIKNKMKYICRGDGQCDIINPNHRNSCRFCRLQRCLKAGMQPESVRMPKEDNVTKQIAILEQCLKGTKEAEGLKRKWEKSDALSSSHLHCPLCHQQRIPPPAEHLKNGPNIQSQPMVAAHSFAPNAENGKIGAELCKQLVRKLVEIETNINEVADFSENEAPKGQLRLESLFLCPEILDRFRTQVNYCIRLRRITEDELEFCKYRTLAKAVDYIRELSLLETKFVLGTTEEQKKMNETKEWLSDHDKITLLRHCFAPLALFDIAAGTSFTTKDTQNLLCLPTGLTVCANEEIVPNGFLSQQIVSRCVNSLVRVLTELSLDQEEFVMVKLIIVLAMDSNGIGDLEGQRSPAAPRGNLLSVSGQNFVERLRDNVHSALYNHSPQRLPPFCSASLPSDAALRFAKLLHILPKLMLLSRDLIENIRMVHTFPTASSRPTDPLFFEMFGDIFHENRQGHSFGISSSDEWSPVGSSTATPVLSPQPQRVRTFAAGHGEDAAAVPEAPADKTDKMISAEPLKAEFGCPFPSAFPLPSASSLSAPPHHSQCLLLPSVHSQQWPN
ncbi:hypothetical protein niasHT_007658 [Heterodera trifolii]|uniref:Uncharacterized protein n=1 Tax=Heterodera trifolii TaxID=157864 RepID=A0ABD2LPT5_9BILA